MALEHFPAIPSHVYLIPLAKHVVQANVHVELFLRDVDPASCRQRARLDAVSHLGDQGVESLESRASDLPTSLGVGRDYVRCSGGVGESAMDALIRQDLLPQHRNIDI